MHFNKGREILCLNTMSCTLKIIQRFAISSDPGAKKDKVLVMLAKATMLLRNISYSKPFM